MPLPAANVGGAAGSVRQLAKFMTHFLGRSGSTKGASLEYHAASMPADLPSFLKSGERARLLPVAADSSKEVRAASIALAVLSAVPDFRAAMLSTIGQRAGSRAKLDCYTEVVFASEPPDMKCRPDGLLVLEGGKGRSWSCLVEVKIGSAMLDAAQVERYAALAKLNGIDAVLTISNQFVATPTHSPLRLSKSALKGVDLFHWSWMFLLTQALLVLNDETVETPAEEFILREFARHVEHPATGASRFEQMNAEWKDLVSKVQSGAVLARTDPAVEMSVGSWHQAMRDLSLMLSRQLRTLVTISLTKPHREDYDTRLKDDSDTLLRDHKLTCTFDVPDAAAPMDITADLLRRSFVVSMSLAAPKDKQRASARINWLLKQLTKSQASGVQIRANWPGRAAPTQASLEALRANPECLEAENKSLAPYSFDVLLVADLAGKFAGRRTFIEHLEEVVPLFYKDVGEHLRAYVPPPPKLKDAKSADKDEEPSDEVAAADKSVAQAEKASGPQPTADSGAGTKEQGDTFFYLDAAGEQHGPCLTADLKKLHAAGTVTDASYVYRVGDEEWKTYGAIGAQL
jgi:hypothetical protein